MRSSCWTHHSDDKALGEVCSELTEELGQAKRTLALMQITHEEVLEAREDFIRKLADEIRDPVQGMMALALTTPEERNAGTLGVIRETCTHVMTTINDLLQITTVSSGRLCMENVVFNPRRFLEVLAMLAPRNDQERCAKIGICVHKDVPNALAGDLSRLRQCILKGCRYLFEAMEHPDSTMKVSLSMLEVDDPLLELIPRSKKYWTCLYEMSIATEVQKTAMLQMGMVEDSDLTLIADIIECTGGRLLCSQSCQILQIVTHARRPIEGGGTTWRQYGSSKDLHATTSYTVLVMEPNTVYSKLLCSNLVKNNHTVDQVKDPDDVLASVETGSVHSTYDCLVVSPTKQGLSLIAAIRNKEIVEDRTKALGILLSVTYGERDWSRRYQAAGADGILLQPCSADVLLGRIEDCIVSSVATRSLTRGQSL
jgi:CheY-like chemotaxis protein